MVRLVPPAVVALPYEIRIHVALTDFLYTTAHPAMEGRLLEDIIRQQGHPLATKFWLTDEDVAANVAEANSVQANLRGMLSTWALPIDTSLRDFPVQVLKHFLLVMRRRYPKLVCSGGKRCTHALRFVIFIKTSCSDKCPDSEIAT